MSHYLKKTKWPDDLTKLNSRTVRSLVEYLEKHGDEPRKLKHLLAPSDLKNLLQQSEEVFKKLPNCLTIRVPSGKRLTICGDTHGHFYDVMHIFKRNGFPSPDNWYLFNGDFVSRGAWGCELMITLFAYKLLYPECVHILRGNHETAYCGERYGFLEEMKVKYSKEMYNCVQDVFEYLPLAAVILPENADSLSPLLTPRTPRPIKSMQLSSSTLDLDDHHNDSKGGHEGDEHNANAPGLNDESSDHPASSPEQSPEALQETPDADHDVAVDAAPDTVQESEPRLDTPAPAAPAKESSIDISPDEPTKETQFQIKKRYGIFVAHGGLFRGENGEIGSIEFLQNLNRCCKNPEGDAVEDILWSDPQLERGHHDNNMRGCAICFGPDVTKQFLQDHHLALIIRSHEGPDAREKRCMRDNMMGGYSCDHFDENGRPILITLFSAANYPYGPNARGNMGAFAVMEYPDLDPVFYQFETWGTPEVPPYFDDSTLGDLTDKEG